MAKASGAGAQAGVHIKWTADVADHDYSAAEAYLSLKLAEDAVTKAVHRLRKAPLVTRRANDILFRDCIRFRQRSWFCTASGHV